MSLSLHVNDVIELDGEELHFHHYTLDGDLSFMNRATAEPRTITLDVALTKFAKGELAMRISVDDPEIKTLDLSTLKQSHRQIVDLRLAFVKAILAHGQPRRMATTWPSIIADVAALHNVSPPNWATVRRWVIKFRNNLGDARALIPAFRRRGRTGHVRSDGELNFLNETLADCMASNLSPSTKIIYGIIKAKYAEIKARRPDTIHWKCPSLSWLYERLRRISAYDRVRLQQGKEYADQYFKKIGKGLDATFRLEVVEIDHTRANVIVKDAVTGVNLGRPWITIAIDRFTRMVVGLYIGFEPPSTYSVAQCLRNMILPKTYLKELCPELMLSWDAYGLPVTVIVDNAMEFRSDWFRSVGGSLGFDIHQQPVDKPEFKGIVERFNKTLEDGGMVLPNRTFGSVAARGKRRFNKGASITLEELRAHIHTWLVAIYLNSQHSGIMDVPARRWEEEVKKKGVSLPHSVRDLDFVLGITKRPQLTRQGVRAHNLFYNSAELSRLYNRIGGQNVDVSIDPADVSMALVTYSPEHLRFKVPCTDQEYSKGLTLHQHNLIRALARKRNYAFEQRSDRVAARDAFFLGMADIMASSATRNRASQARKLGGANVAQPSVGHRQLESMILEPQDDIDLNAVLAEDDAHVADDAEVAEASFLVTPRAVPSATKIAPLQKTPMKTRNPF